MAFIQGPPLLGANRGGKIIDRGGALGGQARRADYSPSHRSAWRARAAGSAPLPDGYDSADLDGQSTSFGNGLHFIFNFDHTNNVTIDGLSLHNFQHSAFHSTGNDANVTLKDFIIFNGFAAGNYSAPAGISFYGPNGITISHGVIHDISAWGINVAGANSTTANYHVDHTAIWNTCSDRPDCSGVYQVDTPQTFHRHRVVE
jgi:hypothetical protein